MIHSDPYRSMNLTNSIKFFPANDFNKRLLSHKADAKTKETPLSEMIELMKNSFSFLCNNFRIKYHDNPSEG